MKIQLHNLAPILLALLGACAAAKPSRTPAPAEDTSWYEFDWLTHSPCSPSFLVLDTESSLGPYAPRPKRIDLGDLVRMHGHACDGLVMASAALSVGLMELYPNGVIDRTDTGCVSNNSPCFGDAAAYLTGGRVRFGTQRIEPKRGLSFLVHRFSTGETIEVSLRDGILPPELHTLESKLKSGNFEPRELRECQLAQWNYARGLLQHPLKESFVVKRIEDLEWTPDRYEQLGTRGDIVNRNASKD